MDIKFTSIHFEFQPLIHFFSQKKGSQLKALLNIAELITLFLYNSSDRCFAIFNCLHEIQA